MSHYLPSDAVQLLLKLSRQHRFPAFLAALSLVLGIAGSLRVRQGRWSLDVFLFATILTFSLVFVAACLYLLWNHPGYHLATH